MWHKISIYPFIMAQIEKQSIQLSLTTVSLFLKVPHPVRSTTSLSLPLTMVPPTPELVAVYPAQ